MAVLATKNHLQTAYSGRYIINEFFYLLSLKITDHFLPANPAFHLHLNVLKKRQCFHSLSFL